MKSILLYANEDGGTAARLEAAVTLARTYDGHIVCLQATPYDSYILGDPFGGVYALPEVVERVREAEDAHRARIEAMLPRDGLSWEWQRVDGAPVQSLIDRTRLADVVVVSLPPRNDQGRRGTTGMAGDVALHVRAPVLAMPIEPRAFEPLGPAAVAWNGSIESAHALRLALPMLARARSVHLITVDGREIDFAASQARDYLALHGIAAELREWPVREPGIATTLIAAAESLDASYLVMGAYGHSRLREAVLGGATRDLLESSPIPLVLAH
jgi:nucleotide-binding universal stress UspA family protein